MKQIHSVGFESQSLIDKATLLANDLGFKLDKDASDCLFVSAQHLSLKIKGFSLLKADFTAATWAKRKAEGKKQGIIKACKPKPGLRIIDATAGWGRDAAVLASFGAQVLMLERHPVMGALLVDALAHQSESDKERMNLSICNQSAKSYITQLNSNDYPDVIYIDPMHPERNKSALVKKDMQVLQQMIGTDVDAQELIECALSHVKQRVVVKWPQKEPALITPNASIEGKTIRFDIYLPKKFHYSNEAISGIL